MFDPSKFTASKPKPLPVLLLLDVSGSMQGKKIFCLNRAVDEMISALANDVKLESEILVSIITFGQEVKFVCPFTPAAELEVNSFTALGGTPLGVALQMAKALIEDRDSVPSRSYRPTVVLVSDGQPTDKWEQPLNDFISSGRSQKCDRMAMAIGDDADRNVLNRFIAGTGNALLEATNSEDILSCFKKVTMSVSVRASSSNQVNSGTVENSGSGASSTSSNSNDSRISNSASDSNEEDDDDSFF